MEGLLFSRWASQRRYRLIALIVLIGPRPPSSARASQDSLIGTLCQLRAVVNNQDDSAVFHISRIRRPIRSSSIVPPRIWFYSSTHPSLYRHHPLLSPLAPLAPTHPSYTSSRSAPTYTSESTGHRLRPSLFAKALIIFVIEAFAFWLPKMEVVEGLMTQSAKLQEAAHMSDQNYDRQIRENVVSLRDVVSNKSLGVLASNDSLLDVSSDPLGHSWRGASNQLPAF